jgi:excisionase family DNA binding protein
MEAIGAAAVLIRKGVKLLEEREGDGDVIQRQREYILSIRFALNQGEVLASPPLSFRPGLGQKQHEDGFFEHRTRINRDRLIPGLFYAVQGMRIGGYRKVAISPHLAYGEKGVPDTIPPHAKLIAEIKVLRTAEKPRKQRQEVEVPEAEVLTQDDLCERYGVDRPTLWRWRKEGRLPAAVIGGRKTRWRRSTIEQWEADGRPRVSPSLDEANERWDQAFARLKALSLAARQTPDGGYIELTPAEQEERMRLLQEIDTHGDWEFDLLLELALLMDEAGQWNGPPIERLLDNGNIAGGANPSLARFLRKALRKTI